jgi:hypothetical protein
LGIKEKIIFIIFFLPIEVGLNDLDFFGERLGANNNNNNNNNNNKELI